MLAFNLQRLPSQSPSSPPSLFTQFFSVDPIPPMSLLFESLTSQILESAFEVSNELGAGFLESVYEGALYIALMEKNLQVERQVPIKVHFRNQLVGQFVADLLVEDLIIVELKAVKTLAPEHSAQALNYLKATGRPVAMLINFGSPKLEYRRFDNRFKKLINRDEGDEKKPGLDSNLA